MGRIFLIAQDDELVELTEAGYPTEADLQALLARYPALIPGDEVDPEVPRRWLLIARETGVPVDAAAGDRLSLDHLFVDQDGVPTLVEVKRTSDIRIRREVVGQMLDYAANGVAYWPVDRLRTLFERTCDEEGTSPEAALSEFLDEVSPEEFWKRVKTNLQAGRIRMVFVADGIPPELQRVVEFLNTQMDPAEVLAVEIPRFSGGGLQTLVPRLVGQTAEARSRKSGGGANPSRSWDEPSFLQELERQRGAELRALVERIMRWCGEQGLESDWGSGAKMGSFYPTWRAGDEWYAPFALWTYGRVETQFQYLRRRPPFDDPGTLDELRRRFNELPGVSIGEEEVTGRPSFDMEVLIEPESLEAFYGIVEWMLAEIQRLRSPTSG